MKITTFNPMVLTREADTVINLLEEIGFERRHQKDNIDNRDITNVRMKDENGFYADIAQVESMARDMQTIRMNVRDFDEAYKFLKDHGFVNARGEDHSVDSESARSCLMFSPTGFSIQLTQHIRKEDR